MKEADRNLFSNFSYLYILQFGNVLLPYLTLPYLSRVLGPERFGLVFFALNLMQFLGIITDYGLNLYGTQRIAQMQDDRARISMVTSTFLCIQIIFAVVCVAGLGLSGLVIPKIAGEQQLFLAASGIVLGRALFPLWFFQGMEKMAFVTLTTLIPKIVFTACVFLFVTQEHDYVLVVGFQSAGFILSGLVSLVVLKRVFGITLSLPRWGSLTLAARDSSEYFFSRVAASFYTVANVILIGFVLGDEQAGYYSAAEKIFTALVMAYAPITDGLYPYMANKKRKSVFKTIFALSMVALFVLVTIAFWFALEVIVIIYGEGFDPATPVLKILSVLAIIQIPAVFLGYPLLGAFGQARYVNNSVVAATIVHIILVVLFWNSLSITTIALITIASQLVVFGIRLYGVIKTGVWKADGPPHSVDAQVSGQMSSDG